MSFVLGISQWTMWKQKPLPAGRCPPHPPLPVKRQGQRHVRPKVSTVHAHAGMSRVRAMR